MRGLRGRGVEPAALSGRPGICGSLRMQEGSGTSFISLCVLGAGALLLWRQHTGAARSRP